jgi:hypothetical protein
MKLASQRLDMVAAAEKKANMATVMMEEAEGSVKVFQARIVELRMQLQEKGLPRP